MKIKLKFWFFRNYWWLLPLVFVLLSFGTAIVQSFLDFKLIITLLGTLLSLLYFLQKQRLEETRLFREIFSECNKRYDELNKKLNKIVAGPHDQPLQDAERMLLDDYFNLCGEEFLCYMQGYVFPEVWKSWYNGMKIFIKNPRIAKIWEEEKKSESYYGLSF